MDDPFALLRLQIEWGADEALDTDPLDRLRAVDPSPASPRSAPSSALPPAGPPAGAPGGAPDGAPGGGGPRTVPPAADRPAPTGTAATGTAATGTAAERALAAASQADTPEALRAAIAAFDGCALRDTASHLVWSEGPADSAVLIVGEAPGREEDRTGHPFAGADGALLDQMLGSIGLDRTQVMLTPMLPWRPPGERPPSAAELAICLPFLQRLIALQQPRHLVLFGTAPAKALLTAVPRRRAASAWTEYHMAELQKTIPTLLLPGLAEQRKSPAVGRFAWAGLRLLRRALDAA
ncbi:uracil-DNA glycosylase [Rhodopila sp.]|uniref:uracil-DNA glycosylase n=1 Tax=Rhodopila sp. TaxID=2480087 RepID=UPI002CABB22A|nr:uracil-DNA glycosylase [Rhodopila sp.]HVZ07640.1 uracil-DNA glycosylase [Rhodopila sp.]